jgi:RNA polymerase sigma factor (sigma-70 family)
LKNKKHKISEEDLVLLLSAGDERAIEIIYDNYSGAMYGVIFRLIQNREVSEDVLQESFIKIWQNSFQYNPSKGRLFTWIINISRHLAIDKRRSKDFKSSFKNQSLENTVNDGIEANFSGSVVPELMGLKDLIENLEPEQKKIIDLLYFGGFTQEEVSENLKIPLGTVKTRSRNALISLRKNFNVAEEYK